MWSFLWRPGWILTHLLVVTMVVVMVNLGLWQLRRLDERRTMNATIEARGDQMPLDIAQLLPEGPAASGSEAEAVAHRPVILEGRYLTDDEVLVRNRSLGGAPGYWVLTPLVLSDGSGAVAINRGWVPFAGTDPEGAGWDVFAPPDGTTIVSGTARAASVPAGGLVGSAGQGDPLKSMANVDLLQLSAQIAEPLYPVYVDLIAQDPPAGELPVPVPRPELSEGSHLGYAGQWFIFSALTVIVYGVMLSRVARGKAGSAPTSPGDPEAAWDLGPPEGLGGPHGSPGPQGPPGPNGRGGP